MRRHLTALGAGVFLMVLGACTDDPVVSGEDGACVSRYESVTSAATWKSLRAELLDRDAVASIRVQERGQDVGVGDEKAVRVVDLLDEDGRRLAQLEVWRADDGGWSAGQWSQCID